MEMVKLIILRPTVIEGAHVKVGEPVEVDPATARILLAGAYPKAARVNGNAGENAKASDPTPKPRAKRAKA